DGTSGKLANYTVTPVKGTLSIGKAALSVTVDAQSKTYGDANPAFTVSYSGFVLGQSNSVLGGSLQFSTVANGMSPVGSYEVFTCGLTSANYAITFHSGTLTVGKADLTVAAKDASKVYGDNNPALTGTLTGIKNGDAITASYSTVADAGSVV